METIEQIVLHHSARGMTRLLPELPADFCMRAAREVLSWRCGVVVLLTGFDVGGAPETDGPTGTYVLACALVDLGYRPVVVSEASVCAFFASHGIATREVHPGDGADSMRLLLDALVPVGIVSIERCGRTSRGVYLNMRGVDISAHTSPSDELVVQAALRGIHTVGVGDGGNEIGMGNVARAISRRLSLEPCTVTVDCLVIATVSNWGAYGIVCALGLCAGRSLLPLFGYIDSFYRFIVDRGSVDGTTGARLLSVDGFSMEVERDVVEALRRV